MRLIDSLLVGSSCYQTIGVVVVYSLWWYNTRLMLNADNNAVLIIVDHIRVHCFDVNARVVFKIYFVVGAVEPWSCGAVALCTT